MSDVVQIDSISQVHQMFDMEKPGHPLVTVLRINKKISEVADNVKINLNLFSVSLKFGAQASCQYGRSHYDFEEGTMVFTSPGQVMMYSSEQGLTLDPNGWTLLFHPDLIRRSELSGLKESYSFFHYDVNEALHLSDREKETIADSISKIETEIDQRIDKHTQAIVIANIKVLLDYCLRYFDRQFYTRSNQNRDVIRKLEQLLMTYYQSGKQDIDGIPSVDYCGKELGVSPYYLSDLLRKETGKNASEHIYSFILEKAKDQLLGSAESVSKIAYALGFSYPQHFSKLFKSKTGFTPSEYRRLN